LQQREFSPLIQGNSIMGKTRRKSFGRHMDDDDFGGEEKRRGARVFHPSHFPKGFTGDEAIEAIDGMEEYENLKMRRDFGIPDDLLKSFLSSHPLFYFFRHQERYDTRVPFLFRCRGKTYCTTVSNYRRRKERQLSIRFCDGRFCYTQREFLQKGIRQHKRDTYDRLDADKLKMPFLASLRRQLNARLDFCYSVEHRRIDILFRVATQRLPILLVTFETGLPEYEFREEEDDL